MKCPRCGRVNSRVLDSRARDQCRQIKRRRICLAPDCAHRWPTWETTLPPTGLTFDEALSEAARELREAADRLEAAQFRFDQPPGPRPGDGLPNHLRKSLERQYGPREPTSGD